MLRYARTFLICCCSVLLLALVVWGVTYSPSYQKCTKDHANYERRSEQSNLNESIVKSAGVELLPVFLLCEGTFVDENNGTLTALATIAIAGFTLTLWRATTQQAELTRQAIELGNREFIATHRAKIRVAYIKPGPVQVGLPPTAEIWAINIGDSDAQITEIGVDIFPRPKGVAGAGGFDATPHPYPDALVVVTSGKQASLQVYGRHPLVQQVITGIHPIVGGAPPPIELCIVGTIHYLDENRTHRVTSFFRIYNPNRLRFMRAPDDDEYAEWDYEA